MEKNKILIGWGSRDITPKGKVSLRGQFHVRITEEVHDPLSTTALALEAEDGSEQAIIVSLDSSCASECVIDGVRAVLTEKLPGFNPENIFISATHSHTTPTTFPGRALDEIPKPGVKVMTGEENRDLVVEKISEAAIEAWNSRKIGALSWGRTYAVIGFNRRVSYFDGSCIMYGKTDLPEFSHIEGREDHGIDMLFTYDSEHKLTGMVINLACPAQCTEGAWFISADYWHETRKKIRAEHGENLYILPQCAAAGDQSPRTMLNRQADARMLELKGYGNNYDMARRQDIADKIGAAVSEVLPLAAKDIRDKAEFAHKTGNIILPRRIVSTKELNTAKEKIKEWKLRLDKLKGTDPHSVEYSKAFRSVRFYQRVIDFYAKQQNGEGLTLPLEIHVLRIGDIAVSTNRFEYFLDFGQRIKARSKAIQTFVVQLAGEGTYLPTEIAVKSGNYGAYVVNAPIGPEGGQIVVEESLGLINSLWNAE
jgi:hypothetical protein